MYRVTKMRRGVMRVVLYKHRWENEPDQYQGKRNSKILIPAVGVSPATGWWSDLTNKSQQDECVSDSGLESAIRRCMVHVVLVQTLCSSEADMELFRFTLPQHSF